MVQKGPNELFWLTQYTRKVVDSVSQRFREKVTCLGCEGVFPFPVRDVC